jgi:NADH dehydrogenase
VGCWLGKLLGWFQHDVFITREEIRGLMSELLYLNTLPTGKTPLTDWMKTNAAALGL